MTTTSDRGVRLIRTFDAPRSLVWKAWTEPARFMQWWGPAQFTSPVYEIDLRVGGKFLWCMELPDGQRTYTNGEYLEVVPDERLVYTTSFADEHGTSVPATHYGMTENIAMEMRVTVVFEESGGKTTMTLTHEGIPAGELQESSAQGWGESFDKLAASLR